MSCGPRKLVIKYGKFDAICALHDQDYEQGIIERKEVDRLFLRRMMKASKNIKDMAIAFWMYQAVRWFGWLFYGK